MPYGWAWLALPSGSSSQDSPDLAFIEFSTFGSKEFLYLRYDKLVQLSTVFIVGA
jgi:hypothetical protein